MNKLAIGMLAALAAGLGQAAVTVGTGETVSAAAEDYVLEGGTLVFETPGQAQAFGRSISGYGEVVNATGVPVGMSGATLSADGGTLVLKGTRTVKARWIRFTSLATRPDDPTFSNQGPQLGEIEILKNGVVVPYSGHTVTCTSGETSYDASAVFDNNNFSKAFIDVGSGTKPVVFTVNLGAETEFDAYRFYVGRDCPGRDPITFTFEVSSDGQDWTLLHSATNYRPTMRDACLRSSPTENFTLVPRTAFCSGNPTVTVAALAELDLVDTVLEIAAGSVAGALRLVDGQATISDAATFSGAAFGDGELVLDGVEASGTLGTTLTRTCRFVRFTVTRNRGNGVVNDALQGWAMSRLNLTLGGTRVAYPAGSTVTLHSCDANMNSSKAADAQSLLTDDNSATFFNLEAATPIMIEMPEPVTFDGYNWWSRGDMPCRDPRSWIFEVSEDGEKWVTLETVIDCPYQELATDGTELRNEQIYGTTFTEPGFTVRYLNGATFSGDYANTGRIVREDGREIGFAKTADGLRFAPMGDFEFEAESELPGKRLDLTGGNLIYTGLVPLTLTGYDISAVRDSSWIDLGHAVKFTDSTLEVKPSAALSVKGTTTAKARYVKFISYATRPVNPNWPGYWPNYDGDSVQMNEFQLLLKGIPLVYAADATATGICQGKDPKDVKAFVNNNIGDKDGVGSGRQTTEITIDLKSTQEFDAYRFYVGNDCPGRDPYTWAVEISQDGETWTRVSEVTEYREVELDRNAASDSFSVRTSTASFTDCAVRVPSGAKLTLTGVSAVLSDAEIAGELEAHGCDIALTGESVFTGTLSGSGTVAFDGVPMGGSSAQGVVQRCRYYRFTSLRTRPNGTYQGQGPQIMEIQLLRNGVVVPYDATKVNVSASPVVAGANLPALCNNNVNAGDKCFYPVGSATTPALFTADLGHEMEFDGYNWWSGNDGTGRDPYNWRFEVSNDGVSWVMLDEVLGEDTIPAVTDASDNISYRNYKMYEKTFGPLAQDLFSDTAALCLGPAALVTLDNVVETVGTLSGAGTVTLSNGATLVVCPSEGNRDVFSGEISGLGTLVVRGGTMRYRKATFGAGVEIVLQDGGRIVEAPTGFAVFVR